MEYFTKEIETLKKEPNRNCGAKVFNKWDKETWESIGNRADCMEERISELEDRNLKMIQVGEKKQLRSKPMGLSWQSNG